MQLESHVSFVRIAIQVVDAVGIERRGTALDAVHLVAFREQELGEIGAVLAGDAGNQRFLCQDRLRIRAAERAILASERGHPSGPIRHAHGAELSIVNGRSPRPTRCCRKALVRASPVAQPAPRAASVVQDQEANRRSQQVEQSLHERFRTDRSASMTRCWSLSVMRV